MSPVRFHAAAAVAAAIASLAVIAPAARAQEKHGDSLLTVRHYLDMEGVADPQISPDGARIVYTRRWVNRIEDRFDTELWIMNAAGSHNRRLTKGASPVWSPDGTRIAYLADGEPRGRQIFVRWMDDEGASSQITRVDETPMNVKWSPDGRSLGFTMFVATANTWKIDMPEPPKGARWTPAPRFVRTLHFKQDRRGFMEPGFRHLFVVSAEGGTPQQLTKGEWNVGARFDGLDQGAGWDWIDGGRSIVFDGFADTTWDANYRLSYIYAVNLASGAMRRLTTQPGSWTAPVVSPDGRRIALEGNTHVGDSYHAGDVYVMDADGGNLRDLAPSLDRDVGAMRWAADGSGIWFNVDDRGSRNVYWVAIAGGSPRAVTTGEQVINLGSVSRAGVATGTRSSYYEPGDVVRLDLRRVGAGVAQLTHVNADMLSGTRLGKVERFSAPSSGGGVVDGWVVKPPGFDSTRKYPLIMEIHGGPHAAYLTTFSYQFQNFAANDFVVVYVNPRGSTSYGSAFGNAIMHAYPSVDYDDLMAAVDAVIRRGFVDTTAMYVGGCSGGGVLSSWVIGHTNRFAAAAVRCPVIDWMSMAGETDIPLFTYGFFDKPFWEDPKPWLEHSSLMYVGNVTTPTVVMTGELDRRTPMPQSEEFYAALRMRGVPAALLRFDSEFHGTGSRPSNFMRTQLYMMSWYKRWHRTGAGSVTMAGTPAP